MRPQIYAICKLGPDARVPDWAIAEDFWCVTRTAFELSVVCEERDVPAGTHAERGRRLLRIEGTLAFSLTGVLASVVSPLADAQISIFAVSTYDTDYLLVREADLNRAVGALESAGHTVKRIYE